VDFWDSDWGGGGNSRFGFLSEYAMLSQRYATKQIGL